MKQKMNKIDRIYVINLPEQSGRLKRVQALLKEENLTIPITYVKATHWSDPDFIQKVKLGDLVPHKNWEDWFIKSAPDYQHGNVNINIGQMACCYTHLKVLETIRDKKETALVLQDDVYWNEAGQLQRHIDDYHDLILQHNEFGIYYVGRDKVFDEEELNYKGTKFIVPSFSWNAHAFIVSHISCELILGESNIWKNMIPFDEYLPTCWGKSPYADDGYVQYTPGIKEMFPKKIDAISSKEFLSIYQGTIDCLRYKDLAHSGPFSVSDIAVSPDFKTGGN